MATSDRKIWIDGELVPWADATVHVLSHSLQRGSLVFDFMSVHNCSSGPAIFRLDEHVERFLESCELTGLELDLDAADIRSAIGEAARANPGAKAIKVSGYLASIEIDVVPVDNHVTIAIAAYDPAADIAAHKPTLVKRRDNVRLWIEKALKNRRADIVPAQAKTAANYASPMVAKRRARAQGYDEVLLIDEFGNVAEGPTTNVFMVDSRGVLRTPPTDRVLLGVTRSAIIEIAAHDGLEVREVAIRPEEMLAAAEVFLTGTTAGVLPVESIDGQAIGATVPGPISSRLAERFRRAAAGEDATFAHWLTPIDAI